VAEHLSDNKFDRRIEIVIATVLCVSGLATSWASYQAALFNGQQSTNYTAANQLAVEASRAQLQSDGRRIVELNLFTAWLQAKASNDARFTSFYEARFPDNLKRAFDAWKAKDPLNNPDAPRTPFAMPGYRPEGADEAEKLTAKSAELFNQGRRDNRMSDLYTQGAVFLATALFFGGIGQVFEVRTVRLALLAFATLACLVGLIRVFTLPHLTPG
jgi:hypothetical protein